MIESRRESAARVGAQGSGEEPSWENEVIHSRDSCDVDRSKGRHGKM